MLKRIANTSRKISRIPGRSLYTLSVPQYSSTGEYEGEGLIENKSIKHNMLHDYEMEKGDPLKLVQHTNFLYKLQPEEIRYPLPWLPRFQRIQGEPFPLDNIYMIKKLIEDMKHQRESYKTLEQNTIKDTNSLYDKELKDFYRLSFKDRSRRIEAWEKILKDREKIFKNIQDAKWEKIKPRMHEKLDRALASGVQVINMGKFMNELYNNLPKELKGGRRSKRRNTRRRKSRK